MRRAKPRAADQALRLERGGFSAGRRAAFGCAVLFSAWPVISYRNRLGMVSRGLPHLRRVRASDSVSRSWAA